MGRFGCLSPATAGQCRWLQHPFSPKQKKKKKIQSHILLLRENERRSHFIKKQPVLPGTGCVPLKCNPESLGINSISSGSLSSAPPFPGGRAKGTVDLIFYVSGVLAVSGRLSTCGGRQTRAQTAPRGCVRLTGCGGLLCGAAVLSGPLDTGCCLDSGLCPSPASWERSRRKPTDRAGARPALPLTPGLGPRRFCSSVQRVGFRGFPSGLAPAQSALLPSVSGGPVVG